MRLGFRKIFVGDDLILQLSHTQSYNFKSQSLFTTYLKSLLVNVQSIVLTYVNVSTYIYKHFY